MYFPPLSAVIKNTSDKRLLSFLSVLSSHCLSKPRLFSAGSIMLPHSIISTGGGEGGDEGRKALHDAAQMLSVYSPTLIVTAGMRYAFYVERKGYVVLDGARMRMDEIVQSLISTLGL